MADTLTLSNFTGLTESGAASTGSTLNTGDLRRRYNFGSMVSMLRISQDPFFRFLSALRKNPTDDPQFKFTEERPSFHRRYAFVTGHGTTYATAATNHTDATVTAANIGQGDTYYFKFGTDYKSAGNIASVYGQSGNEVTVGDAGTKPEFIIPGLLMKIPFGSDYQTPNDYIVVKIEEVTDVATTHVVCKTTVIRTLKTSTNNELQAKAANAPMDEVYSYAHANTKANLESKKSYVVGTAFAKGSGYPDTWADNPYSTGYGLTQIWKTAFGMDNTTRATVLKYKGNEWLRVWANKLIEHKWDIETDLLFGTQYTDSEGIQYTQGAVDYIINYGTKFSLDHSTKTADDFLDDMSQFMDPRYNNSAATLFMADTYTYNWLNKMAGYFNNNVQISPNFRADFSYKGTSNKLGVAVNKIATIYGDMNIVRNVHLDGTGVYLLGVNMNYVNFRPLAGNGLNRDTSVYVGVQTLENTGVDKRVDLIMTEAGMEWQMPGQHCAWTA